MLRLAINPKGPVIIPPIELWDRRKRNREGVPVSARLEGLAKDIVL